MRPGAATLECWHLGNLRAEWPWEVAPRYPRAGQGRIQAHAVTAAMRPRLEVREHLFAEIRAAIAAYDPVWEFLVLVWLPASMFFYRRERRDAGSG